MFSLTGFEKNGDYLKVGDNYLLFLNVTGKYMVNGQEMDVYVSYSKAQQVLLSEVPEVSSVTLARKELLHYKDAEGNIHTQAEVRSVHSKWQDEDGDYGYPDLDTEFAHRKELEVVRSYEPVYEEHPAILTPVETRLVGEVVDTGSKYIENALAYGGACFSNGNLCKLDLSGIAADELRLFVAEHDLHDKYENPSHGGVRFAKIGGKHVMYSSTYSETGKYFYTKTLKDAQDKEASVRAEVRNHLNVVVLGTDIGMTGKSVAAMYGDIENWIGQLSKLDVKQKSTTSKTTLISSMRKVKDTLHTLIK